MSVKKSSCARGMYYVFLISSTLFLAYYLMRKNQGYIVATRDHVMDTMFMIGLVFLIIIRRDRQYLMKSYALRATMLLACCFSIASYFELPSS